MTSVRVRRPHPGTYPAPVIRDVVIHMQSEQPLKCDLKELPTARDACVMCTNLRMVDGRKPTFIDEVESWFLIPLDHIRLVEMPAASVAGVNDGVLALPQGPLPGEPGSDRDPEEELLRRIREA